MPVYSIQADIIVSHDGNGTYKTIKNSPQYIHAMHTILLIMTLNTVINESKPINQNQY